MLRGEVWWAKLPQPQGARPVLLLSRDKAIQVRSAVTIAPLSRTIRGLPTEVLLDAADGVPKSCAVNLDSLQTIPKVQILDLICRLKPLKMTAVNRAIKFALELD